MTAIREGRAGTDAFQPQHAELRELLAAERLAVAAVCSRYTLERWLETAVRLAPNASLSLLVATDLPLWRGRAADLLGAVRREELPPARRFALSRGGVRSLRCLRSLRPGAFLVLADRGRSAARSAQLLGLLSGAPRVCLLSTSNRALHRVRPRDCLTFAGQRLRSELWQNLADLPAVGRALQSLDRATVERCLRAPGAASPVTAEGQLRVLLIYSTGGDSTRYRMEHKREHLQLLGFPYTFRAAREYVRDPHGAARDARDHDVAIIHRLAYPGPADLALHALTHLRRPIVYDIDDLLFDPGSAVHVPAFARRAVVEQAGLLPVATHAMASTEYLAERLAERGKRAFVIGNVLSGDLLEASRLARARRAPHEGVRLGYLSGSPTHDRDLAVIGPALAEVLGRHAEASLVLVGTVAAPVGLAPFGDRITRLPAVPWRDLPPLAADLDINLAPLEIDSPFCRAKSALKYVEAGAVGVPTVATPTPAFEQAIRHGETGLLATSTEEWVAALEALITRAGLRGEMGEAALREVEARYTPEEGARQLGEALREIAGNAHPEH